MCHLGFDVYKKALTVIVFNIEEGRLPLPFFFNRFYEFSSWPIVIYFPATFQWKVEGNAAAPAAASFLMWFSASVFKLPFVRGKDNMLVLHLENEEGGNTYCPVILSPSPFPFSQRGTVMWRCSWEDGNKCILEVCLCASIHCISFVLLKRTQTLLTLYCYRAPPPKHNML